MQRPCILITDQRQLIDQPSSSHARHGHEALRILSIPNFHMQSSLFSGFLNTEYDYSVPSLPLGPACAKDSGAPSIGDAGQLGRDSGKEGLKNLPTPERISKVHSAEARYHSALQRIVKQAKPLLSHKQPTSLSCCCELSPADTKSRSRTKLPLYQRGAAAKRWPAKCGPSRCSSDVTRLLPATSHSVCRVDDALSRYWAKHFALRCIVQAGVTMKPVLY